MRTLVLPPRYTDDSARLSKAAARAGWSVERLPSWHVPSLLRDEDACVYGEPLFAIHAAAELNLALMETPYDWLARQPAEYVRREVSNTTLANARSLATPRFVKPAMEKFFKAGVHATGESLPSEDAASGHIPVIVAEPVAWDVEFRSFVLDRRRVALSAYLVEGRLAHNESDDTWPAPPGDEAEAATFLDTVLADPRVELPPAIVLDVGRIRNRGWAIVETNPAWGSGIYGCDSDAAFACVGRSNRRYDLLPPNARRRVIDHQSEDFI